MNFWYTKHAVRQKRASGNVRDHWLDHAEDRYDKKLIEDIKIVIRVLVLYIPLPLFWALFDQQVKIHSSYIGKF